MSSGTCTFCASGAKYVCPRCGVPYCSLPCYRSSRHERCSEGFYRECVMDSLRREQPDPAVRRRMEETLAREARLQADDEPADSDDSDSENELSERMRGVDLDDAEAVWSRLTPAERDEFRRQADGGAIACDRWRPWWTLKGGRAKVTEVGREAEVPAFVAAAPPLLERVPPLSALIKQPPSPLVINSVINALYAYAHLRLLYDGDWSAAALEASGGLCLLSGCLSRGEVMDSGRAAVQAVDFHAGGSAWQADEALRREARAAVQQLLAGPGADDAGWYVLAALSDLWRLLEAALAQLRTGRDRVRPQLAAAGAGDGFSETFGGSAAAAAAQQPGPTRPVLRRMMKKLEYLFAWSKRHQDVISETARGPKLEREVVLPSPASEG